VTVIFNLAHSIRS